jgi:dTDP-4-dehydrorhamnose reductase
VTGAGGMLGREVVRAASEHDVVALTHAELDVTDREAVAAAVEDRVVINCAGFTDVDGAEADEEAATVLNGVAPGHLAAAARAIVHPSTDYVFDGTKREPYVESDPTAPRSAYGRSKLAGEHAVAVANPRHFIVRTSWLFGVGGRNFVDTMLGLASEHGELKVVADQVGCPTYVGHLAKALVELAESDAYGIHHVAGAGACSWFEFATEIFRQVELDVRVTPCTTGEFPRPAPRPAYSVLVSERTDAIRLPDWHEGLAAYLAERAPAR